MRRHKSHLWRLGAPALTEQEAGILADALSELGEIRVDSVSLFEGGRGWEVEAIAAELPQTDRLATIVQRAIGRSVDFSIEILAERDWVAASLESLPPVVAGRTVVHGSHGTVRIPAGAFGLEIEASLAFGTGHHGSTRGCLEALQIAGRQKRPQRILDIGTGTGVLAMAAARLFRRRVLASDIDAVAVRLARENAKLNGVAPLVEVIEAAGLSHRRFRERAPFDLVLANILAGPLAGLAKPLCPLLAPRARIILSGLLPAQEARIVSAYRIAGLKLMHRFLREGWSTLMLAKS